MGLGTPEIVLIALALLLIFGAKRIPEIARGLGKGLREFKDATKDIKRELTVDVDVNAPPPRPAPPSRPAVHTAAPSEQETPAAPPAQDAKASPAPDAPAGAPDPAAKN